MAHSLTHWKYALNEWVVGELKSQGYLTPEKLAAREEMNTKKRSKIAEGIVDSWESSGEIKKLYGLLKAQLETASQGGPKVCIISPYTCLCVLLTMRAIEGQMGSMRSPCE